MPAKNENSQEEALITKPIPLVGKKAPAFNLPSSTGKKLRLKDYIDEGKNVVLYFYPRDNTPGCTQESCDFRDNLSHFESTNTVVLGISGDSLKSHEKFINKYELPFPLLADEDHAIAAKYGVWVEKKNYGKTYMGIQRATFLINKEGKIAAVWPKVKVKGHVEEVKESLAELG